jgi:hypothetical protein
VWVSHFLYYAHSHFFSRHASGSFECLQNSEFLLHYIPSPRSRGSVGSLVTRLGAHGQVKALRFPAVARDFSCKYPHCFSGLPSLQFHALRGLSQKMKWQRRLTIQLLLVPRLTTKGSVPHSAIRRHDVHSGNLPTSWEWTLAKLQPHGISAVLSTDYTLDRTLIGRCYKLWSQICHPYFNTGGAHRNIAYSRVRSRYSAQGQS